MRGVPITEFLERYNRGDFSEYNGEVFGTVWREFFCYRSSLVAKTKKMYTFLKGIHNKKLLEEYNVFFRNNCTGFYPLYDTCFFESKNNGLSFEVQFDCGRANSKFSISTSKNFNEIPYKFNTMKELREWIENF